MNNQWNLNDYQTVFEPITVGIINGEGKGVEGASMTIYAPTLTAEEFEMLYEGVAADRARTNLRQRQMRWISNHLRSQIGETLRIFPFVSEAA